MAWTFEPADLNHEDVRELLAFHFAEMQRHSPSDACHVLPLESLRDQALTLFALRDEFGHLLGLGALREIDLDHGELKSMRTEPPSLGRGVGGAVLSRLIAEARRRGYSRLSLETGSGPEFAAARRLYEREGFVPCEPFGGYAHNEFTRFLTRDLSR